MDSDDELERNCIEFLAKPLKLRNYDFIIGNYKACGFPSEQPPLKLKEGEYFGDYILKSYCDREWYMMAWNKLVRCEFLLKNELYFYSGIIHEDDIWSFRLACRATSMYVCKDITITYYRNKGSIMTSSSYKRHVKSSFIILKEICKMLDNYKVFYTLQKAPQILKMHMQNCYQLLIIRDPSDFSQIKKIDTIYKELDQAEYFSIPKEQTFCKLNYIKSFGRVILVFN